MSYRCKASRPHEKHVLNVIVGRLGDRQKHSSYIQYQISKALVGMLKSLDGSAPSSQLPPVALPSSLYGELTLAVSRAFEVSRDEMCRQIAYHAAGDDRTFDSTRLAYSILTYVAAGNGLVNSAGVQMNYGEEDSAIVGKGVGVNKKVLMKAVDVFMGCQNNDGMWPQGQSIYSTFNRKDTNVGNAFVFSCDTLGEMLQVCGKDVFASHMDGVERLVDWCDRNYVSEVVTLECDVESGECFGKQRRGWVSNHFPPGTGATAWSTAQALIFMARARRITRSLMNDAVLSEFGGTSSGGRDEGGWKRLVDADVAEGVTLKNIIMERVLEPRATASAATSQKLAAHSAVLFGPPGTAKTTICKVRSEKMRTGARREATKRSSLTPFLSLVTGRCRLPRLGLCGDRHCHLPCFRAERRQRPDQIRLRQAEEDRKVCDPVRRDRGVLPRQGEPGAWYGEQDANHRFVDPDQRLEEGREVRFLPSHKQVRGLRGVLLRSHF